MRTLNGGEEFRHEGEEPDHQALIDRLVASADRTLRVMAAAPYSGRVIAPSEFTLPFPPQDAMNKN